MASPFSLRSSEYVQVAMDDGGGGGGGSGSTGGGSTVLTSSHTNDNDNDNLNNNNNPIQDYTQDAMIFRIDDDDDDECDHKVLLFRHNNSDDDLEAQPLTPTGSTTTTTTTNATTTAIPSNYICPLTLQIMNDPVNDGCGHTFERTAIADWLEYHEMCPISRKPLHMQTLYPATDLARRIQEWKDRRQRRDLNNGEMTSGGGDHSTTTAASSSCASSMVDMDTLLLPQELKVLQIIKIKARIRRFQRERNNCIFALALTIAICLFIATCLAMKYLELELRGPI